LFCYRGVANVRDITRVMVRNKPAVGRCASNASPQLACVEGRKRVRCYVCRPPTAAECQAGRANGACGKKRR